MRDGVWWVTCFMWGAPSLPLMYPRFIDLIRSDDLKNIPDMQIQQDRLLARKYIFILAVILVISLILMGMLGWVCNGVPNNPFIKARVLG